MGKRSVNLSLSLSRFCCWQTSTNLGGDRSLEIWNRWLFSAKHVSSPVFQCLQFNMKGKRNSSHRKARREKRAGSVSTALLLETRSPTFHQPQTSDDCAASCMIRALSTNNLKSLRQVPDLDETKTCRNRHLRNSLDSVPNVITSWRNSVWMIWS